MEIEPIKRLYPKDKMITRSLHIDQDLYEKLQYLSENELEASVSKLINISVETMLQSKNHVKFYKKPYKVESIYRSVLFRQKFYDQLLEIKDETGISFTRLVNGSIKEFLDKYDGKYFTIKSQIEK